MQNSSYFHGLHNGMHRQQQSTAQVVKVILHHHRRLSSCSEATRRHIVSDGVLIKKKCFHVLHPPRRRVTAVASMQQPKLLLLLFFSSVWRWTSINFPRFVIAFIAWYRLQFPPIFSRKSNATLESQTCLRAVSRLDVSEHAAWHCAHLYGFFFLVQAFCLS